MTVLGNKAFLCGVSTLALAFALPGSACAGALPGHGHFANGSGSIARAWRSLTVDQQSVTAIVDWKSFSVGKANNIRFDNGHGATLNIVKGGNLSRIAGDLSGTGSVYLINRAGVLITGSGRVDTQGSFSASSRDADDDTFSRDERLLLTGRVKGNVINRGAIASGASVTLYGADTRVGNIAAKGNVETSGARVKLVAASVTARNWLVDPKNLTVTAASAKAIDTALDKGTNVALKTTATSTSGPGTASKGPGDITIASAIVWKGAASLTLDAYRSVNIDANVTAMSAGKLAIATGYGAGSGGDLLFGTNDAITFDKLTSALKIDGKAYTLEHSIANLVSAIAANPGGRYALTKNIDLGGRIYAAPLVSPGATGAFEGTFEGLGHTISNLTIDDATDQYAGLFGYLDTGGVLRDIGLSNANVTDMATADVGTLVGFANSGTLIAGAHASGTVTCGNGDCGGLAGEVQDITNSFADVDVSGGGGFGATGGLVGYAGGTISNSHATGNVGGGTIDGTGGLAGWNVGTVSNSYATGNVSGGGDTDVGGLIGYAQGNITDSYATGNLYGQDAGYIGGLVGYAYGARVSGSHATGSVSAGDGSATAAVYAGGLVGYQHNGAIRSSYATGDASAGSSDTADDHYSFVGGLVGFLDSRISGSHASGDVSVGLDGMAGGLFGENTGTVANSHATGDVFTQGGDGETTPTSGGLGGLNDGTVSGSYATGNITDENTFYDAANPFLPAIGGLIGGNGGTIAQSFATGNVAGSMGDEVGGLVGYSNSGISNTYATGRVTCGAHCDVGGLVGYNADAISGSYAIGRVMASAGSDVGGVVGQDDGGSYTDVYWDISSAGTHQAEGTGATIDAIGYTTAHFKKKTLADLGFDQSVWAQSAAVNGGLPYLKGNPPP